MPWKHQRYYNYQQIKEIEDIRSNEKRIPVFNLKLVCKLRVCGGGERNYSENKRGLQIMSWPKHNN